MLRNKQYGYLVPENEFNRNNPALERVPDSVVPPKRAAVAQPTPSPAAPEAPHESEPFRILAATKKELVDFAKAEYGAVLSLDDTIQKLRAEVGKLAHA